MVLPVNRVQSPISTVNANPVSVEIHVVVTSVGDKAEGSLAFETADDVRSEPVWNGTYFIWQHEMGSIRR
jgi:hypothetical protein